MRLVALLAVCVSGSGLVLCQTSEPTQSLFSTVRADVTVVVRKHSTGADMVEITMRDPNYPVALLQRQVEKICAGLGSAPRGLQVAPVRISSDPSPNFVFIKANFATDGIIDTAGGALHIAPILKGFAGAPPPYTIQGLALDFESLTPSTTTLQRFAMPDVLQAEGRYSQQPPLQGLEYRIKLLTQDPDKIVFPNRFDPAKPQSIARPQGVGTAPWLIISVFAIVGLAVGALVYFALLRTAKRARP
jgi:hypothetical protein